MDFEIEYTLRCPHCGHLTGIDPALLDGNAPMVYCPKCDEPLLTDPNPDL